MNRLFRILSVIGVIVLLVSFGYENILSSSAQAAVPAIAQLSVGGKSGITSVAISPDGMILAGGNEGTQIDLWDVSTATLIRTLSGHLGAAVMKVAFSPDGKLLASAGGDSIVRLWDVATGQQLREFHGHEEAVRALAFSPDGKTLVSGGEDTRVLVWDISSGKLLNVLSGHTGFVSALAFSRDGKTLASGSEDSRIILWDIATGQERQTLRGHSSPITDIAFSPDGTSLVSSSEDKTLRLWDAATGTQRQVFQGPARSVRTVAYSPDGKTLISGGDDNLVTLWDVKTGRVLKTLNGHTNGVTGVAFTPDGTQVVGASADNQVLLWGATTGQPVRSFHPSASPKSNQPGPVTSSASSLSSTGAASIDAASTGVSALAPTSGPGGPILVITTSSDPFSTYYAEILRNEGLNEFATADISTVTTTTLSGYDVVLLAHMSLTSAQVTMFSNWVNSGGNLITMQPDKQLASLLGLTDTASTLSNGYLLVDTTTQVGNGIVGETIQFHGVADRYSLSGASSLATLYANATTSTTNPAVTLRTVGTGHAAAFVYDLARSIAYTRQGNPAWSGQERDGVTPIRSDDLYYGAAAGDPQPDWVDLNKVSIPQADEQQRLLANLILNINLNKKPLPRFWYFPRGFKAVVIMTGDDHANGGTPGRFDQYIADSPANCNVANWECVRSTSYVETGEPMTNAQAASYVAQGFEIGLHVTTNCLDWTPASLASTFTSELSSWVTQFPSLPAPVTNRTHCIVWSDWSTQPQVELNNGMRLDTNYYYWPPTWITDRPGFFTGSGMPMRFVDLSGTMIDIYQATTQMTDESGQSYPYNIDTLLNNALGSQGYYGAFTVNAHTDTAFSSVSDAVVASAQARGVPIVSSKQMLTWLDGRNNSSFGSLAWNGTALSFTITPGAGATGLLQALVPLSSTGGVLTGLTLNGSPVSYTVQGIKGVSYAAFMANAGSYVATYTVDTTPPTVLSTAPANGATGVNPGASVSVSFSEALDPTTVNGTTFELRDPSNTLVSAAVSYDSANNRAVLVPTKSLTFGTTYTATVKGGATDPRVKDLSGNALATNFSWSFATAAAPACPCNIWSGSATPQNPSVNDPNAVELGVKFQSDIDGQISGIRFYKGVNNTGTHVGSLWTSSGTLLAQATFSGESATGWQQVNFATPVAITANTVYVASYHTSSGNYAGDNSYFATAGVDNPPLHALRDGVSGGDGIYAYGATSSFPINTYLSSNYWVDVVFTLPGPDTTPPTVTAVSPTNGATGVSKTTSVAATFNEALDSTTINSTTFQLLDPSNAVVPATVSYDTNSHIASLAPNSPLLLSTTYTAVLKGGAVDPRVKDLAGNALAANYTWSFTTAASSPCDAPANPIVAENCLPGNPASEWDVSGSGDASIQGFATDISVNRGGTISFKIDTNATSYRLDIYRMGYYGGMGARKITTVQPSATLPQNQPACLTNSTTGLIDCGNWGVSASWTVPANATSGIYFARLVRTDTGGASHIVFVVRDDTSTSDLLFQTSDTTWQAYNTYGGNSLYVGGPGTNPARAYKVSYNRPITTRDTSPEDFVFNAEYPMVRWLEANGYNVSYFTGVDSDRNGSLIANHKVFMSVGHDEYWSGAQRSNVEAARTRGVSLAFFSGNEIFWKTRWEASIDGSGTSYRTLVCYKETHANARIDPLDVSPTWTWTGSWRDPRFSPPSDGGRPENALSGNIFMVNDGATSSIVVPSADGKMRFWRNTSIANLGSGASYTLPFGTLGYEWDEDLDNGFRPAGVIRMSTTTVNNAPVLQDFGSTYGSGTAIHNLTLYRSGSGALVFGAGTVQWSWGLDSNHDRGNAPVDVNMQQATVNLFADMNAQPVTLQTGLVAATASTDTLAPTSTISSPANGANVQPNIAITISGSAVDSGGGVVGGVEVSVDGGVTWHPAVGRSSWSYIWTPTTSGSVTIKSRAVDDSGNLETPSAGVTITVGGPTPTATSTPTSTPANTPTPTPVNTATPTPTPTATNTPGPTPTATNTPTPTPVVTNTPTPTPSATNTPTPTPTPTNTPTPTPTPGNTNFFSPTANAPVTINAGDNNGYELNPTNAYTTDGAFAQDVNSGTSNSTSCTNSGKDKQLYFNYGISIPGTTVTGIIVRLDALVNGTAGSPKICVQLSWNGGSSWTAPKSTSTLTTSTATYLLGSSTDTWGHTWTTAQLTNANFRVRVIDVAANTSRTFSLDGVAVQVFYR